jgi:hypothetical protein
MAKKTKNKIKLGPLNIPATIMVNPKIVPEIITSGKAFASKSVCFI